MKDNIKPWICGNCGRTGSLNSTGLRRHISTYRCPKCYELYTVTWADAQEALDPIRRDKRKMTTDDWIDIWNGLQELFKGRATCLDDT